MPSRERRTKLTDDEWCLWKGAMLEIARRRFREEAGAAPRLTLFSILRQKQARYDVADRELRIMAKELTLEKTRFLTSGKGYYYGVTRADFAASARYIRRKAFPLMTLARAIEQAADEAFGGQLELGEEAAVESEVANEDVSAS
jgi:hypothetical protein